MSDDVIKMNVTTQLTDSNGQPIQVNTQQPEYLVETFSFKDSNSKSEILTGNGE